jgi:uncharacterized protein (TIGR02145 family)
VGLFNLYGRTILSASALCLALAWLSGCAKKPEQEAAPETSDAFTDERDGQKYKIVTIGGKRWMAQNLNYQPSSGNSWCYDSYNLNCNEYGRLYDWNTAKSVCPHSGWHLPSNDEWQALIDSVGGSSEAGRKLKADHGWYNNGNGTDEYGFSALPGGARGSGGSFKNVGRNGYWWTATKVGWIVPTEPEDDSDYTFLWVMLYNGDGVPVYVTDTSVGLSVRCVKD